MFEGRGVGQLCTEVQLYSVVGLMVASPGRREMEGTNDCTVGRRGQRPDIAHEAQSKLKCITQSTDRGKKVCTFVALVECAIISI